MPGTIHEEGKLKRNRALLMLMLALALLLAAVMTGCALTQEGSTTTAAGESTTTTLGENATPADQAIAALTQSPNIQTPQTVKPGTLLAGSDTAFPPMQFLDEDDNVIGFEVDLCRAIAKKMGLEFEVVSTEYDALVSGLEDGQYDLIMSALPIVPELSENLDFTDAHLPLILGITTPTSAPIADEAGLAGKRVGVQVGTMAQARLEQLGTADVREYDRILTAFDDMLEGELDAVVIARVVSDYILGAFESFGAAFANTGSIDTGTGYGFGAAKGNTALVSAINTALAELRTEGVYQLIIDKWELSQS